MIFGSSKEAATSKPQSSTLARRKVLGFEIWNFFGTWNWEFGILTIAGLLLLAISAQAQIPSTNQPPVPPAPVLKSPVDFFRSLLAMGPSERREALTNRPAAAQKLIIAKLREYEMLPPDLREVRLRETELRWYLLPLMSQPRTNRDARLALIPEEQRKVVEERLTRWDLLPPPLQKQLLNSELTADYFVRLEGATKEEQEKILAKIPPERRAELESGVRDWRAMSADQRQKTLAGFTQFFELTPKEKAKTLNTLSDEERQQMEKTIAAYNNLSPAQRVQCLRSFEKFAGMSLAERQQFLRNAERWQEMSPAERQAWRQLVSIAPIMPPGKGAPTPPLPPMPNTVPRKPSAAVATN